MKQFDAPSIEGLQQRNNMKWAKYPQDILPMWVADMDFPTADVITQALADEARANNLVYQTPAGIPGLQESVIAWQKERYHWHFEAEDMWLVHGIVPCMFLAHNACTSPNESVIMQTPIYPPFMMSVKGTGRDIIANPLVWNGERYEIDFDAFEAQITPATRLFMLCNPQNPTGRVFEREELERLAEIVLKHRLWVLSDELHSDLVFDGKPHIPFASLSDEVAQRTITLFGPSKTFNLAGLKIGVLVTQNKALMQRLKDVGFGVFMAPNTFAQRATLAAYQQGGTWLSEALTYLDANRQLIAEFMGENFPMVPYDSPEGTYLSWFDLRPLQLGDRLENVLLEEAKLGLNMGDAYGEGGQGFARLNFATSRQVLIEGLERLKQGLAPYID